MFLESNVESIMDLNDKESKVHKGNGFNLTFKTYLIGNFSRKETKWIEKEVKGKKGFFFEITEGGLT